MHAEGFFFQALVYLSAAVIAVPIAKRFGLGSVLGYLFAGVLIGPFALGFVGQEGQDVMHFAEFGVVMMLFVVGLELEPERLWRLRVPILGLGGLQVVVTAAIAAGLGMGLGCSWRESIAIGLILSASSTAIALQTLTEKGLIRTSAGQSSFAVLLFQDIAVIPMLALFPLLRAPGATAATEEGHDTWLSHQPAFVHTLVVLGVVAAIIVVGRFALGPVFRALARTHLREVFTAATLLLVIGVAVLMTSVGLSPALGTFVAGVVLAQSEYRHELETDIDPFKGLLLGLFFIAVGASIDFGLVARAPGTTVGLVFGVLALKGAVLFVLARLFRVSTDQGLVFAVALSQVGEFAFVLLSFATQQSVLPAATSGLLSAAVALSMAVTPMLFLLTERVLLPRLATPPAPRREHDAPEENAVIVAGFGRFGQVVTRLLRANGLDVTVLEHDSDQVELLRKFGHKVFYGDASRLDLLRSAGAERARVIVLAIDSPERTVEIVHTVRKHFPNLQIVARARSRTDAYELIEAGVDHVHRELFGSSLRAGVAALRLTGMHAHRAHRAGQTFARHDEQGLRVFAAMERDAPDYISQVRQTSDQLEQTLRDDLEDAHQLRDDSAWDPETLRDDVQKKTFPVPQSKS